MSDDQGQRLHRVGALWKGKEGSKAKGSGSITVNGLRQKFAIFVNDKKREGSRDPDYILMSSEEPEVDQYAQRRTQ